MPSRQSHKSNLAIDFARKSNVLIFWVGSDPNQKAIPTALRLLTGWSARGRRIPEAMIGTSMLLCFTFNKGCDSWQVSDLIINMYLIETGDKFIAIDAGFIRFNIKRAAKES